jgi:hypothetical protein
MPLSKEVIAARKKLGIPMDIIGDPEIKDNLKLLPKSHPLKQAPKPLALPKKHGIRSLKK